MFDEDLMGVFFEDAQENIEDMEKGLLSLEQEPNNSELIDLIFRAVHTLKSGAGMVGLDLLNQLTHEMENLLDNVRSKGIALSSTAFNLLLKGTDLTKEILADQDPASEYFSQKVAPLIKEIKAYEEKGPQKQPSSSSSLSKENNFFKIILKFKSDVAKRGINPLRLFQELENNGSVLEKYINLSQLPTLDNLKPQLNTLLWTIFYETALTKNELAEIFFFVADQDEVFIENISEEIDSWFSGEKLTGELLVERGLISDADIEEVLQKQKRIGELLVESGKISSTQMERVIETQKQHRSKKEIETVRVKTKKLEKILNNVSDLVVAQSRVKKLVVQYLEQGSIAGIEVNNAFGEVDKIIRLLQEDTMEASMIPIGTTFLSFQRMVRDLSAERGKKAELIIRGKETELDKRIIEQLTDPLKHLIRNAIDHGLETPAERLEKNKSEVGSIQLQAFHQQSRVIIEIIDDGKGVDHEKVFQKAVASGLVDAEQKYSTHEIHNLLFLPGFSTAQEVSDISGRGVGLDCVMSNIKSLGGEIELFSEKDRFTKFHIKLPLTQAILDGMVARLGNERFIFPITAIFELVKASKKDFHRIEGKGLILNLRHDYIPFVPLAKLAKLPGDCTKPDEGILVIIQDREKKLAIMVDEIIGQEQVVIKSIEKNVDRIDGVTGATILGDGRVALILDIAGLFYLANQI